LAFDKSISNEVPLRWETISKEAGCASTYNIVSNTKIFHSCAYKEIEEFGTTFTSRRRSP